MRIGDGRNEAAAWVERHLANLPGFRGAYFIGSTASLSDDAEIPAYSDIDVVVVVSEADKFGASEREKLGLDGVLLEVTVIGWSEFESVERVSESYHLATGLSRDTIIADNTGDLRALQIQVEHNFTQRQWVLRRCANAWDKVERGLRTLDPMTSWHDLVLAWLFATGVTAQVPLVAALRNPTVRRRYVDARDVLTQYGVADTYGELLRLLGSTGLTADRVGGHVANLERTFDASVQVSRTRMPFSADITPLARPLIIDASRELISAGYHQEAMFWIGVTFARCTKILAVDAPRHSQHELVGFFDDAVDDLGIASAADLLSRAEECRSFLPELRSCAMDIVEQNRLIER